MTLRIRSFFWPRSLHPFPIVSHEISNWWKKGLLFKHLRCCIRIAPPKKKRVKHMPYISICIFDCATIFLFMCISMVFDQSFKHSLETYQLLPPQQPPRCRYWKQVFDSNQCRWKHWNFLRHDKGEVHPPFSFG